MEATSLTPSWCDVPEDIKWLLSAAADNWEDTERSQVYINQAIAHPAVCLDVLVAAYRYFFYKHNDPLALQIATQVMERIQLSEALPSDWQALKSVLLKRNEEPAIRLYLNAYAASGLVLARLGALGKAQEITARVSEIDSKRESCAATVFSVLTRVDDEDE